MSLVDAQKKFMNDKKARNRETLTAYIESVDHTGTAVIHFSNEMQFPDNFEQLINNQPRALES